METESPRSAIFVTCPISRRKRPCSIGMIVRHDVMTAPFAISESSLLCRDRNGTRKSRSQEIRPKGE